MSKGPVPTDPDGRREAVNVPVAAVRAPDGDLDRGGIVPVREAVEHHRGVGGSYRHRDRLSGSVRARSGIAETTGCAPVRGTAVGAAGGQKRNDTDTADWARCRLIVTAAQNRKGSGPHLEATDWFDSDWEDMDLTIDADQIVVSDLDMTDDD